MINQHVDHIRSEFLRYFKPRPTQPVSQWCTEHLRFDEPGNTGPFSVTGREYVIEPLDDWGDDTVTDETLVFGSQSGKTGMIMGGVAWLCVNSPSRVLWVMPGKDLAGTFSNTRWRPMLRASPVTAPLVPVGAARHQFKTAEQHIGGSIIGFVGSHSPAALASNPCRVVVADEVDKFSDGGSSAEADAVSLAEQRTKRFSNPKRIKTSTPTMVDGLIWQEYIKGDQRRYHIPCPHCGKLVILGWSAQYTIMPKIGCEAWVKWDPEARRKDGTWDLDRVVNSARAECPFCQGHIREEHKSRAIRAGKWIPTAQGASGHRSRHLPSLYALSKETSFGILAKRFIEAKRSLMGVQGFVNGDLAEPFEGQDISTERVEHVVSSKEKPLEDGTLIMTVDVQRVSPFYWYVIRRWQKSGSSRLEMYGSAEQWEDLEQLQKDYKIEDRCVMVDSGWNSQEVYGRCMLHGKAVRIGPSVNGWCGWMPMKGREGDVSWLDPKTKIRRPYYLSSAPIDRRGFMLGLLEFCGSTIKDMMDRMRHNRTTVRWEVTDIVDEVYWRHMDSEFKKAKIHPRTQRTTYDWVKRSSRWPDHLRDCEVMQIVAALWFKLLNLGERDE